jgi:hypothetical protein
MITAVNFSYAKSDKNDIEKANILSKLNILKGNGVDYDLDGNVDRDQTATFIVRFLIKDDKVEENKQEYSFTSFNDVERNKWYAPYIGYCAEKGIINGYSDKTFAPNKKLGEQAFLKLLLTALNYKYNEDFTWGTVYEKAYGVGLVKDVKYANGYVDKEFTRGDVVKLLYTALQLQDALTRVRSVQSFVDKGIISKDEAIECGLVEDTLETEIDYIKATGDKTVEIKFNEKVNEIKSDNIIIYETENTSNVLPISSITKKNTVDTYTIILSESQQMDVQYTVLIDAVVDLNGNKSETYTLELTGFRPDEIKSDYFKISKINPISNNTIYIYFTHPINDNALQASFYTFYRNGEEILQGNNSNMLINKLSTCNNGISIYLNNYMFTDEEIVQLSIDGNLASLYGVRLNEGTGDSIKFKTSINSNVPFTLDSCVAINNHTIQLDFNKEVNPVIAKQIFSYYITDENNAPIKIKKVNILNDGANAGKTVRLILEQNFRINKEYKIMINHLTDITRQFSIVEKQYSFIGSYYSAVDVQIEAILPIDDTLIILYMDRPVDQESAEMIVNYQIRGVTNSSYIATPTAVYYNKKEDPRVIKLYMSKANRLKDSNIYTFRLMKSLRDTMGNYQSKIKTCQFTHSSTDSMDTYISEAKVIGENTIKLYFNKEIALDIPNVLNTNYKLSYIDNGIEYSKIPIGANYIDPRTIILKFDILDTDKEYKIYYNKLIDYGKNETDNLDQEYYTDVIMGK